jgi:hypothetical protein
MDRITALEAQVAALKAKLQFVTVANGPINGLAGPHVIITGANVHIRSGSGETDDGGATPASGLGNLIIGYNEEPFPLAAGERDGAHNLVVGPNHRYTNTGGFVAGFQNRITGIGASVSGGGFNTASGFRASVSGGGGADDEANIASGQFASISGGRRNTAGCSEATTNCLLGRAASVSGGQSNRASGEAASVSGGFAATADGELDWRAGTVFSDFPYQ